MVSLLLFLFNLLRACSGNSCSRVVFREIVATVQVVHISGFFRWPTPYCNVTSPPSTSNLSGVPQSPTPPLSANTCSLAPTQPGLPPSYPTASPPPRVQPECFTKYLPPLWMFTVLRLLTQ